MITEVTSWLALTSAIASLNCEERFQTENLTCFIPTLSKIATKIHTTGVLPFSWLKRLWHSTLPVGSARQPSFLSKMTLSSFLFHTTKEVKPPWHYSQCFLYMILNDANFCCSSSTYLWAFPRGGAQWPPSLAPALSLWKSLLWTVKISPDHATSAPFGRAREKAWFLLTRWKHLAKQKLNLERPLV